MRHLTHADYVSMPWANGRGITIEMLRIEIGGGLLLRLSMATVSEDGPFSVFPNTERSLTVIQGPGFRLQGKDISLECRPLVPVAFPGDVAVRAVGTGGKVSEDFNVMTAAHLPKPEVTVLQNGGTMAARGGRLCLLALAPVTVNDRPVKRHDLVVWEDDMSVGPGGPAIAVRTVV
ncbi:MAG: hypothetical protein DI533_19255 [Cereibacter sphaeroides]|uniref:HutD family protein n=1 Tax=Cereibacter sphaeroides TaxID=1063 RepID=A0A2W5S8L5_CERSP|nr:MAG: hypothetical protein DI533_19255 [Cereibacter sphaeroides]